MTTALRERAQALGLRLSDQELERLEPMVSDLQKVAERLRLLVAEADAPE